MIDLLNLAIKASGGLDRFNQFSSLSAFQRIGGAFWQLKGQEGVLDQVRATIDLHQQHVRNEPFKRPNQHSEFTPQRVAIEDSNGVVLTERTNPRAAFAGHTQQTPWDELHLIYFNGCAMSIYLTFPFIASTPGFEVSEIEPWQENNETWRRLLVNFPAHFATHSSPQTFYIDANGFLRRHDYNVDIAGASPTAHYIDAFQEVSGIVVPTRHLIYPRQEDNSPLKDLLLVSIELSDIAF